MRNKHVSFENHALKRFLRHGPRPFVLLLLLMSSALLAAPTLAQPLPYASSLTLNGTQVPGGFGTGSGAWLPLRRGRQHVIRVHGPLGIGTNTQTSISVTPSTPSLNVQPINSGAGYIDLSISVPSNHPVGPQSGAQRTIALSSVAGPARFNVQVVRRGQITAVNQPTALYGQPAEVTLQGTDIGNALVHQTNPNTEVDILQNTENLLRLRVTPASSGTTALSNLWIGDASVNASALVNGLANYRHNGESYLKVMWEPGATTAGCISSPNLQAPNPQYPSNGLIFQDFAGNPPEAVLTFQWSSPSGPDYYGEDDHFIIEIEEVVETATTGSAKAAANSKVTPKSPRVQPRQPAPRVTRIPRRRTRPKHYELESEPGQMTHTANLDRHRSYRWRVKPYNCGDPSSFSNWVSFEIR